MYMMWGIGLALKLCWNGNQSSIFLCQLFLLSKHPELPGHGMFLNCDIKCFLFLLIFKRHLFFYDSL